MSKTGLNGSLQNKNGKLYAVIGYNDVVTQKRKMKWISLGLDENDKKSVINRALRDAISDFEDEYDKMLSGLRSPEDYPFLAFLTEWLETVKIKKVQESTINGYRQMVKGQITRYFGDKLTLGDITPRLVMRFYDSMRKEGVSERTILHYHNFLHGKPNALTINMACSMTGYSATTLNRWIDAGLLFAVWVFDGPRIPKSTLVSFLASDYAFRIHQKSEVHTAILEKWIEETAQ